MPQRSGRARDGVPGRSQAREDAGEAQRPDALLGFAVMNLLHTLHQPAGDGPHPTLFVLHGYGANAHDLLGLAPHLLGGRALVIAPQGPLAVPLDPQGRLTGYAWFPLSLAQPPTPSDVAQGITAAREFIDEATRRYPVDPERMGLLGFSQGGVVALALALGAPKRFKALAALSTWLPDELDRSLASDATGLPVWMQHGTKDEVIAVARARDSRAKLEARGVGLTYREYEMGHEISAPSLRDLVGWLDGRF